MTSISRVLVFGSTNVDLVMRVAALPVSGETVLADEYLAVPGGKGANQALAACRAGATTCFISAVGNDDHARLALTELERSGVDLSGLAQSKRNTGCAVVLVDDAGRNQIGVASGANLDVHAGQVSNEQLQSSSVLVLQQEVPALENLQLVRRAQQLKIQVLYNLAPALNVPDELLAGCDWLVVNQVEVSFLAGGSHVDDVEKIARKLSDRHRLNVVVTLGDKGLIAIVNGDWLKQAAPLVRVRDTTGAGDTFVGYLAAGIAEFMPIELALGRAVEAASIACSRMGAQQSIPLVDDVVTD
ncbi:MAG: ribokinase [Pseudomonadota bacterium]|nr:ribokinase [Pseudomonadota bacterium]